MEPGLPGSEPQASQKALLSGCLRDTREVGATARLGGLYAAVTGHQEHEGAVDEEARSYDAEHIRA